MPALPIRHLACFYPRDGRHAAVLHGLFEATLLDPEPLLRWQAYRALLDEHGLRELVTNPDPVDSALQADADAGARLYREWRASLVEIPCKPDALAGFLRAADALPTERARPGRAHLSW